MSDSARIERAARGLSLHVALNEVDPDHYSGWRGTLNACEFDAEDMEALAGAAGFTTKRLIRQDATREKVQREIAAAAAGLRAGDLFLITYSGHGGQVPDYSGDEDDRIDETWCLYDGQFIDDELFEAWRQFEAGVRIFLISDSCHSGSIFRSVDGRLVAVEAALPSGETDVWPETPRVMPPAIAARTYRRHHALYDGIQERLYELGWKTAGFEQTVSIAASVRLFSGCTDSQYSFDGVANGHFTERLLRVWNNGRFRGDYESFHREIRRQMRSDQTSEHRKLGAANPDYDGETPFEI